MKRLLILLRCSMASTGLGLGLACTAALWVAMGALGAALTGCASSSPSGNVSDAGRGEILTESDEPELRRRARIRLELAVGYFEQGQTTVALDELKQSLAADPNYAEAYNLRGLIYMRLGDARIAEESFRRALTLSPRNADVLHNLGWFLCQQTRYDESQSVFQEALASPQYGARAKSWRALGLCQSRAGRAADAEASLLKSYEFDAGNPVTAYNLAELLTRRGEHLRAQFYLRRLNNSDLANSESLWLGAKVERRLGNADAVQQLGTQLVRRFAGSRETGLYQRGAWDE